MKKERLWSHVKETEAHLRNKLTGDILACASRDRHKIFNNDLNKNEYDIIGYVTQAIFVHEYEIHTKNHMNLQM